MFNALQIMYDSISSRWTSNNFDRFFYDSSHISSRCAVLFTRARASTTWKKSDLTMKVRNCEWFLLCTEDERERFEKVNPKPLNHRMELKLIGRGHLSDHRGMSEWISFFKTLLLFFVCRRRVRSPLSISEKNFFSFVDETIFLCVRHKLAAEQRC